MKIAILSLLAVLILAISLGLTLPGCCVSKSEVDVVPSSQSEIDVSSPASTNVKAAPSPPFTTSVKAPKEDSKVPTCISDLELPQIISTRERKGRILREFREHGEIKFFQGSAEWNAVTPGFSRNTLWNNHPGLKKPGVYEWSVVPPGHKKKFSIYRGYASNLEKRLKNYIHVDGIYPKGEQIKTILFKELHARGFKFFVRFRGTDRGKEHALREEGFGVPGGLNSIDYPFNDKTNGGYRQPLFLIGGIRKSIKDFPLLENKG